MQTLQSLDQFQPSPKPEPTMNANATSLIAAVIAVASAASIGVALANVFTSTPQPEVIKLERVVVEGHRTHAPAERAVAMVEQLPTVVITGRAVPAAEVQVAEADKRAGEES